MTAIRAPLKRRADALGALAAGADRLGCRCGSAECAAAPRRAGPVVIHVVAEQSTLESRSATPASVLGADGLIPAPVVAEPAKSAELRPLIAPAGAEPHYIPSTRLAAFVRALDLTCRAPGCDRPATDCDLDHTIPYGRGSHPPVEPEMSLPDPPSTQDVGRDDARPGTPFPSPHSRSVIGAHPGDNNDTQYLGMTTPVDLQHPRDEVDQVERMLVKCVCRG